jgi:hypothetical protein
MVLGLTAAIAVCVLAPVKALTDEIHPDVRNRLIDLTANPYADTKELEKALYEVILGGSDPEYICGNPEKSDLKNFADPIVTPSLSGGVGPALNFPYGDALGDIEDHLSGFFDGEDE